MSWSHYFPPIVAIPDRHKATTAWLEPVEVHDEIDELVNWQLAQPH